MKWTAKALIEFEKEIADDFNTGKIAAPVHLADGNEEQLIAIFNGIRSVDWCLTTWRAHYHALLKGVPKKEVKEAIRRGRSIGLCFPKQKLLSSAIVGGICPIAVGLGWGIKKRGGDEWVHVFIGDMAAESGIYHESSKYAANHDLPVSWYIEDNGKSVCTDTRTVWGPNKLSNGKRYYYDLNKPHVGTGTFVRF